MKHCYKAIFVLAFLSIISTSLWAQQLPNLNHYLINRYLLSPSFGGVDDETKVFIGYRREWANISSGPKTSYVNGYMPASDNVWLGAQIISDQSDIFRNTKIQLSYIYHLQINEDNFIDFSIGGSLMQNSINLGGVIVSDPNDPLIQNRTQLSGIAFNAGAAINYRWRNGNIGLNVPNLFLNKDAYSVSSTNNLLVVYRTAMVYASYNMRINYDLDFEPILVYRYTQDFTSGIELSGLLRYKDNYWVGATYKDIGKTSITIGARFTSNFILNYSYEFVTGAIIAQPAVTHEFSLGFKLGNVKNQNYWRNYLKNATNYGY